MIATAPMLAELFLSLAAVLGLVVLAGVVRARGAADPLNRRFLFALRVAMVLFGARALLVLTGVAGFQVIVLIAAALIPLAVLLLAEGLLRRHAPLAAKVYVAAGAAVFGLLAFWPAGLVDPARGYAMLVFQLGGLATAGLLVAGRDRASLSAGENRAAGRLNLSLLLLIPLAAVDFLIARLGLPVRVSALGLLFLCWLAISLGRDEAGHGGTLTAFGVIVLAAAAATGLVAVAFAADRDGAIVTGTVVLAAMLVAVVWNDARALRFEEHSLSLLRHLADGARDATAGPVAFLRGLQAHPAVEGAALIEAGNLADLDPDVLRRILTRSPVLRRVDPAPADAEEADHVAHLFARFEATHVLLAAVQPLVLVALSMPAIAASDRAELELRAVQRMAALMARGGG